MQSDLYDIMFEYKEQVTTSDPYHCKIPLCLTEHSSLAIKYNPPNRHLLPCWCRSPHMQQAAEHNEGARPLLHLCCRIRAPGGLWRVPGCHWALGILLVWQQGDRGLPCPASGIKDVGPWNPVPEILPSFHMAPGKRISFYTQIRTVSFIREAIA